MDSKQKLSMAIKELQRLTGLPLDLKDIGEDQIPETLSRIKALCSAYQDANNKELVMTRWLTGQIDEDEFNVFAKRIHLNKNQPRTLYYIELIHDNNQDAAAILRSMFPSASNWIIPLKKNQLILIQYYKSKLADRSKTAYEILNMLNSEMMEQAYLSYSLMTSSALELPEAYRQATLAMQIGRKFNEEKLIYGYDTLGISRLIYHLPKDVCLDYIKENLGEHFIQYDSPIFEAEIRQTASCFLQNNLNIAETARQLHVHRNTILYRLEQIQNDSHLDIRRFDDAISYHICSMLLLHIKTD